LGLESNTWLVGLAWRDETSEFDPECILVPAADIPKVGTNVGDTIQILFNPKNSLPTRLDPYRHPLSDLATLIKDQLA